jgi:precorrin-8X/cobalt-precorrin-8 methylmutase
MEWHITDAQSLATIDREIGPHILAPAEYELLRRVIYATADFDYKGILRFSETALQSGAAALAARTTIIVDEPMVQVGIASVIQQTFANPIYCAAETLTRPQKDKTATAWGLETLAKRYPEGIYVIGASQTALLSLANLIQSETIRPALVIATPANFIEVNKAKQILADSLVPHIRIEGRKGNAIVAAALTIGLTELAWQAYGQTNNETF